MTSEKYPSFLKNLLAAFPSLAFSAICMLYAFWNINIFGMTKEWLKKVYTFEFIVMLSFAFIGGAFIEDAKDKVRKMVAIIIAIAVGGFCMYYMFVIDGINGILAYCYFMVTTYFGFIFHCTKPTATNHLVARWIISILAIIISFPALGLFHYARCLMAYFLILGIAELTGFYDMIIKKME